MNDDRRWFTFGATAAGPAMFVGTILVFAVLAALGDAPIFVLIAGLGTVAVFLTRRARRKRSST
jgi:hypothetical protein